MQKNIHPQQLIDTLQKHFGFQEFRPGQLEALTSLMNDGRLLCIQPTGYGKSLLYQLPSVLLDGITLVISPLLALMRDQLIQLKTRFGISAASINSDQSEQENTAAKQAAQKGNIRILFVSPEQLDYVERFEFLLKLPMSLIVVDEAHCISTWGHDFRPSYREITKLAHALVQKNPDIKILGLTATADSKTETDIKQQLTVSGQEVIIHRENMDRPNIRLSVLHTSGIAAKLATLIQLLEKLEGCGLIYCATRENTEIVAEYLNGQGIKSIAYHAGIEANQKRRIQDDFIHNKYPVITATNALGMGIDKSDLRFIIHFDFPGSITAYYQEVGRCGRDGLPAEGVLLYDPMDSRIQKHFIDSAQPEAADFQNVLQIASMQDPSPTLTILKQLTGLHPTKLIVIIAELVEQGFLKKSSYHRSQVYEATHKPGVPDLSRYITQFQVRNRELVAMQRYAERSRRCLMVTLREALGDHQPLSCGKCSRCVESHFKPTQNADMLIAIALWINNRTAPIHLSKKIKHIATGIAVLDGKLRARDFVYFMRERANSYAKQLGMSENLIKLIKSCLTQLTKQHRLKSIIPLPSRTWGARDVVLELIAAHLKIPVFPILYWGEIPSARQGELLNNDQRKHNVARRMQVKLEEGIPKGAILLVDDYTGSGSTLNEAARALRENGQIQSEIVPFTIAAVKWRLGKKGMI